MPKSAQVLQTHDMAGASYSSYEDAVTQGPANEDSNGCAEQAMASGSSSATISPVEEVPDVSSLLYLQESTIYSRSLSPFFLCTLL